VQGTRYQKLIYFKLYFEAFKIIIIIILLLLLLLLLLKAIPLQAWTDPEGSRRLTIPDFRTFSA